MNIKDFSDSAKGFTKSPLGIIALFIVLVYGFASLVVSFGKNISGHIGPLIYFLVLFPVIVFIGFLWLVSKHHNKLYGPSDFKDEENFLKMQMSAAVSLAAATAKDPNALKNGQITENELNNIINLVTRTSIKERRKRQWDNKILWVDDRPNNNIYERKAFMSMGLTFDLALSTNEALEYLRSNKYAAIISDMGRKEGPSEGYVLLEKLRSNNDTTPFFIYAGSNLPEHKREAKKKGAQGCTNNAQELFSLITGALGI